MIEATTILIASSDESQRQLIDLLLSQDGYVLVEVSTAREALAYLRENTPAVSLFASELPDLSGEALCRKAKAVSRLNAMAVILIVPNARHAPAAYLRNLQDRTGADAVLPLPLGDKDLRGRVRRLLVERRAALSHAKGFAADSASPKT